MVEYFFAITFLLLLVACVLLLNRSIALLAPISVKDKTHRKKVKNGILVYNRKTRHYHFFKE
ncbi:hypothetical protein [Bartonella sp. DGB1]|uniref:hypothetical protein n=1 Tax=Bartonella sp. DGB1 TaxID=3239807 RepID=UPI0035266B77